MYCNEDVYAFLNAIPMDELADLFIVSQVHLEQGEGRREGRLWKAWVCRLRMPQVPSACAAGSMILPSTMTVCARVAQRFWECNFTFSGAYIRVSTADFLKSWGFRCLISFFSVLAAAVLVVADQLIKQWATAVLKPMGAITVMPGILELRYYLNDGMAFSMLAGKQTLLIGMTSIMLGVRSSGTAVP